MEAPKEQNTGKKQKSPVEEQKQLLAEKDRQIDDLSNQLKRLQAEFENYIKRVDKERQHFACFATEKLVIKLLTLVDDFEHGIEQIRKTNAGEDVVKGIKMILDKLHKTLDEEGVCPICCKEQKFDPYKHEAVLSVDNNDVPEGTIVDELQKGYTMAGKVIRYSKVKVTKNGGKQK